jgi:alkanesulfonate monooxygenase SsuD/methylene tetrahydromethanopterin reductase-like flavin-dependent oxidoreductase (luciferase family)
VLVEIGIFSFGDLTPHPSSGAAPTPRERMRQLVDLARLADDVGLDVVALGEHHRLDMVVSSPAVVLAAMAEATRRVKLSSATTLLNTLDPVRVYEDFATLDLLSGGRAEMIAGRGSFTESFDLFGYDIKDYDALFDEKLRLLLDLDRSERVTWAGRFRPPLRDAEVAPRATRRLPIWVGVGGSPESAIRAGRLGLPMTIAILGAPERFVPFAQLHRAAAAEAGRPRPALAVSSHGLLLDDAAAAKEEFAATWGGMMRRGLRNRFPPRNVPREYLDLEMGPRGAFFAGGVEEVAAKIVHQARLFGLDRILLQFDWGGVRFEDARRSVELLGREVAPRVRKEL